MATNASEVNWLLPVINDWIAQQAENSYWSLPQAVKAYYASRGNAGETPEQKSEIKAATRGAKYAQEGRINAIRQARGQTAFDPLAAPPAPAVSNDPTFVNPPPPAFQPSISTGTPPKPHQVGLTAGNKITPGGQPWTGLSQLPASSAPSWFERSPAYPDIAFFPGTIPQANAIGFGNDVNQVSSQMTGLQDYLTKRYTGAAQKAGTLSGTSESKNSLNADISAGLPGAQLALQGQLDTAQGGVQNRLTPSTPAPAATAPKLQAEPTNQAEPQPTADNSSITSGQTAPTSLNQKARVKAIQAKGR